MNNNCFVSRVSQSNMKFAENNKQSPGLAPASESSARSNELWMLLYKVNIDDGQGKKISLCDSYSIVSAKGP